MLIARNEMLKQSFLDVMQKQESGAEKSEGYSSIGGYDKMVIDVNQMGKSDIALASNGDIFLSSSSLYLVDVHAAVQRSGSWPMFGNNPQRTGCFDCVENVLSPVALGNDEGGLTQFGFAPPSPNPSSGSPLWWG